ncbi:MAG: hypothetical protein HYX22_01190 [Candidatus Yanofskybacteria bacterium]|nr:hypothetical protein [Candidatus Yanofskybacteria bacterium]
MRNDKFKAYKLRMAGRSYTEINRLLNVPKSTLSGWFSTLDIPPEAKERISKRVYEKSVLALVKRNKQQTEQAQIRARETRALAIKEVGSLSNRDLFIAGISLYWAEGHKKPIYLNGKVRTHHPISLTNSDPKMVALFMRFLREVCSVKDDKISVGIRFFEHQDPVYLLDFWQKIVRIPSSRFQKVLQTISISSKRIRPFNSLPFGVVQIRVGDTPLFHKIMGWIDGMS